MNEYGCTPTELSQNFLDEFWIKTVNKSVWELEQCGDIDAFIQALQQNEMWHSLKNLLLAYAEKTYGEQRDSTDPLDAFATEMYKKTKTAFRGTAFEKESDSEDLIPKRHYLNYLRGDTKTVERARLHMISLALEFDFELMFKLFSQSLGEPPFFFHNPVESIFYYALKTGGGSDVPAVKADKLIKEYRARMASSDRVLPLKLEEDVPSTELFCGELDAIANDPDLSEEGKDCALLDFLCSNRLFLGAGQRSRRAQKVFDDLFTRVNINPNISFDAKLELMGLVNKKPEKKSNEMPTKNHPDSDAEPKPMKDRPSAAVRRDIVKKSMDKDHFVDTPKSGMISKRDIVLLRFYDAVYNQVRSFSSPREHLNFVWEWFYETNEILYSCGLPELYFPCRFDGIILTALASNEPEKFMTDVMWNFHDDTDDIEDKCDL